MRGSPGFEARVVGSTTLVTSVERGSPAWEGGLRPGWEVLRIGEKDLAPLLASIAAEYDASLRDSVQSAVAVSLLHGRPDETLRALFGDGDGNTVERTIALREPPGHLFQAGNIPPIRVRFSASRLAGDVGYIAFNHFLDPATIMPAFNEAMLTFIDAQGIVLDLRGNPGGQAEMVTGMAGWFIPEKGKHLGFIRFRDLQLKLVVRPRPQVYAGPVAVVVDELSTCASEIMALGLRESGRARIFGTRTGGATLGSTIERLPNGDGFQYPFADFHSAAGQRLEGIGVVPDEEVRLSRESLLEGGDVQLEAAIHWIRARTRSAPATDNKIIK